MDPFAFTITLPHDPGLLDMFRALASQVCLSTGAPETTCGPACAVLEDLVGGRMKHAVDGHAVTVRFERVHPGAGIAVEVSGPAQPGDDRLGNAAGPVTCVTDGRHSRIRLTWEASDGS